MHPIVIMAYDKSTAVGKAVSILEDAGLEVRVLNTNHAKLVDFLSALAGDDTSDVAPPAPKEDDKKIDSDKPADDVDKNETTGELGDNEDDEGVAESLNLMGHRQFQGTCIGIPMQFSLTREESTIRPSAVTFSEKTRFSINEHEFAAWMRPSQKYNGAKAATVDMPLVINEAARTFTLGIGKQKGVPEIELNINDFATLFEASTTSSKTVQEVKDEINDICEKIAAKNSAKIMNNVSITDYVTQKFDIFVKLKASDDAAVNDQIKADFFGALKTVFSDMKTKTDWLRIDCADGKVFVDAVQTDKVNGIGIFSEA